MIKSILLLVILMLASTQAICEEEISNLINED